MEAIRGSIVHPPQLALREHDRRCTEVGGVRLFDIHADEIKAADRHQAPVTAVRQVKGFLLLSERRLPIWA